MPGYSSEVRPASTRGRRRARRASATRFRAVLGTLALLEAHGWETGRQKLSNVSAMPTAAELGYDDEPADEDDAVGKLLVGTFLDGKGGSK